MKPLLNPGRMHSGPRDQEAQIRHLLRMVQDLQSRVAALEAKRGPGRPRKDEAA